MKHIVKKHEVGLLFKNGDFVKAVPAGTYRLWSVSKTQILTVDMRQKFSVKDMDISLFKDDSLLKEMLHVIHVKDNEIALHYEDGNFKNILPSGTHAYFKAIYEHRFVIVNTDDPVITEDIDQSIFLKSYFQSEGFAYISAYSIPSGMVGILLKNGDYVKTLKAGNYFFWKGRSTLEIQKVDLRKHLLEITGQELLSEDKVTLRMNFICQYQITDPVRAVTGFDKYAEQLYSVCKLALREYVSTRKLDELLAEKHEIGKIILASLQNKQQDFGAEFVEAGVKDIILPGDIRDILNTVLVAEKTALANVITRREETASTRSLLNTAKLMEENQTLYRLKELEYMERICDKVGNISLSSGAGIIEQLGMLLGK